MSLSPELSPSPAAFFSTNEAHPDLPADVTSMECMPIESGYAVGAGDLVITKQAGEKTVSARTNSYKVCKEKHGVIDLTPACFLPVWEAGGVFRVPLGIIC